VKGGREEMPKSYKDATRIKIDTHMVPQNAEQVMTRILHDLSTHLRRSKETYEITKELPKFPMVDYEEIRRIVQNNFQYLGVATRKYKKEHS